MRRNLLILSLLLFALPLLGMVPYTGWCETGGISAQVGGVPSSNLLQGSFPLCTITVVISGTTTPATLYSDNGVTPLSNPFTANSNGLFTFYAGNGLYGVTRSNGGLSLPLTI